MPIFCEWNVDIVIDGARQFQQCDRFSTLLISPMIRENKQVKFGEDIFNIIEENPMKMVECTLKLHPSIPIKRKQRANSS